MLEKHTVNRLHSNAYEGVRKRGELSGFLEQPDGPGLYLVVRLNLTGISFLQTTEKDIWFGSTAGRIFFRQNAYRQRYSQPWRSCGVVCCENDCVIFNTDLQPFIASRISHIFYTRYGGLPYHEEEFCGLRHKAIGFV